MPRNTPAPYSWPRSVSCCLAEGYRKRRSAPTYRPMWLRKDFTFFYFMVIRVVSDGRAQTGNGRLFYVHEEATWNALLSIYYRKAANK